MLFIGLINVMNAALKAIINVTKRCLKITLLRKDMPCLSIISSISSFCILRIIIVFLIAKYLIAPHTCPAKS